MEDINRIKMVLFKKKCAARWQACEVGVNSPFNSQQVVYQIFSARPCHIRQRLQKFQMLMSEL